MFENLLEHLRINPINSGAFSGDWHSQVESTPNFASFNPATGKEIAKVANCSIADYSFIVERAKRSACLWKEVPAPKRGEVIRKLGEALRVYKSSLGSLIALEMGKSKQEGDGEVQELIDLADFAVGQARMLYGKTMHSERPKHRMYEQWHPYGIVGVISAFNFPVAVWGWNAFIAAICGNVTLWKPSSKTPLAAIAIIKICNEVLAKSKAPEIFSLVVSKSHDIREALVNDPNVAVISFTGSTRIGKQVAAKVAGRLGKTILELGGNNAIIVDCSADLNLAIPAIVFAAIGTAGQRCTSARRLFVQDSIYEKVIKSLKAAYQQITIGSQLDSKILMGPLIDEEAVVTFKNVISEIKSLGGKVLFGGKVLKRTGYFVEPTLVCGLENHCDLIQKETFVPILYIMPFSSLEEAITLQNGVSQGLSSSLFTQKLQNAELFLSAYGSDCGIANINIGTSGAEIGGAFGGEKDTGGGREAGSDCWKAYMRRQTNTINWGNDLPLAQGIEFTL